MSEARLIDTAALSAYTEALSKKLSRVYTAKGSAVYADAAYLASGNVISPEIDSIGLWQQIDGVWTKLTEAKPGWTYNITNKFTTDNNFIDGGGITPAVGINITVVNMGTDENPVLKFDLLATGADIGLDVIEDAVQGKQDKLLTSRPRFIIPDHSVADTTALNALTTTTVSNGDIIYQEDTEEYYYAEVSANASEIVMHDIGNTKTVEDIIKLIVSIVPVKPISIADIQAMFA